MINQILPYVNMALILVILIGVPIMIAVANANYKPEKPTDNEQ